MNWQPIETAPTNGVVLLWNGEDVGMGYFETWKRDAEGRVIGSEEENPALFVDCWIWVGEGFTVDPPPTHWMPLPKPPK